VGSAGHYFHDGRQPAQQRGFPLLGFCATGPNIIGRPLFNYWSFKTPEDEYEQSGLGNNIAWMGHVALHFFSDTRWKRTFTWFGRQVARRGFGHLGPDRLRKKAVDPGFAAMNFCRGLKPDVAMIGFNGPAKAVPLLQSMSKMIFPQPVKPEIIEDRLRCDSSGWRNSGVSNPTSHKTYRRG